MGSGEVGVRMSSAAYLPFLIQAILAVVIAGAIVTYGGVSLFVAFFVLAVFLGIAAWAYQRIGLKQSSVSPEGSPWP